MTAVKSTDFANVSRTASYTIMSPQYTLHNVTPETVLDVNGFLYASAGLDPKDKAYLSYFCRGDMPFDICNNCTVLAIKDIINRCPNANQAIIWYDLCLVRYSNVSFYAQMDDEYTIYMWNVNNISQTDSFNAILSEAMNDATTAAENSPRRFSTKKANFTVLQSLYSLVQCTPDLSSLPCQRCLRGAIAQLPTCCNGKQGGRVFTPSCNIRYELYPFYNETATAVSASPSAAVVPPMAAFVPANREKRLPWFYIIASVVGFLLIFSVTCWCLLTRRVRKKKNSEETGADLEAMTTMEATQFEFSTIEAATDRFSDLNKLGQGGFAEVYKGILGNGQEIAIKRLLRSSREHLEEFKNEVKLVAKLQHRNLARLLGFCWEGDELILVYEFVPNRSLDYFLHDPVKKEQLNWTMRYKIIEGIARGMVYLHHDSRLKIIHRDLKASNVLLDKDMLPKISDFGLARILEVNQAEGDTNRIVGTHGYLSPEYAMHGHFSTKSDVFSFGVLTLEIISGLMNSVFHHTNGDAEDLQNYAWNNWKMGTLMEFLDPTVKAYCTSSILINEVMRCVHIAFLCVHEDPVDRPTMATVVLMLNNERVTLPLPKQPPLLKKEAPNSISLSLDDSLITQVHPR